MILKLSSNSPQKKQVTTINPCILCSDAFRKPSSDLLICVRSLLLSSAGVWGRCKPPVGPGRSPGGGPGGKAPGSSEDTVIYSTTCTKESKIRLSR